MKSVPWWNTNLGDDEKNALLSAFDERNLTLGRYASALEAALGEMLDVPYVVVTPSGTAALTLSLIGLGVGPGDEVIVPALTWIATAQAVSVLGATPVFVDVGEELPLINVHQLENAITSRTKAIVPVHLNGRPCEMGSVKCIADKYGLKIVEDACKAMRSQSEWGWLGTIGDVGCYSMGMISLVSSGYGGFAATRDPDLHRRLVLARDHGVVRGQGEHYAHPGFNFKISDLLCAMALPQVRAVEEKVTKLFNIYNCYVSGLEGHPYLNVIPVDISSNQVPLLMDVRTRHREDLYVYLNKNDINVSRFHPPVSSAPYLSGGIREWENAEIFAAEGLCLPSGPAQNLEDIERVISLLKVWEPGS